MVCLGQENFDGLSGQEKIGQHFPMYCSKIGHSYEAFTCLFCRDIFICFLSATEKFGSMFLTSFGKNKWFESPNHRLLRNFLTYKPSAQCVPFGIHHYLLIFIDFKIKMCLCLIHNYTAFSDTDVMLQMCLPYIQGVAVV